MSEVDRNPPDQVESDKASELTLEQELDVLVSNDPEAPILATPEPDTKLSLKVPKGPELEGHFPSGVAFFAISTFAAIAFLYSPIAAENSHEENLSMLGLLFGTSLIAQTIDAVRESRK